MWVLEESEGWGSRRAEEKRHSPLVPRSLGTSLPGKREAALPTSQKGGRQGGSPCPGRPGPRAGLHVEHPPHESHVVAEGAPIESAPPASEQALGSQLSCLSNWLVESLEDAGDLGEGAEGPSLRKKKG